MNYIVFFLFQHIYGSKTWNDIAILSSHPVLGSAAQKIPDIAKASKSKNTLKIYDQYFAKFVKWCEVHGLVSLPAKESTVCVFLSNLLDKKSSVATLDAYFYSISWQHDLLMLNNPCVNKLVKFTFEGCRRILSKPVVKKQPVTPDILSRLVDHVCKDESLDLKDLRLCVMCILGFSGFLRFDELSSLKMKDLVFHDSHVSVFISKSKCDQLKMGNSVPISKTGNKLCPVSWLQKYISAAGLTYGSDEFLFTKVRYLKTTDKYILCDKDKPLSYTRTRKIFLEAIQAIGEDRSQFGLHSLRSGGASAAANSGDISDSRLLAKHGRWKSSVSLDGNVHYDLKNQLRVSKHLGI